MNSVGFLLGDSLRGMLRVETMAHIASWQFTDRKGQY